MTVSSPPSSPRVVRVGERLVIVGTVHVDPKSVQEARTVIRTVHPSIVALELDEGRLNALVQQESGTNSQGRPAWSGLSTLLLGLLERVAGELTGSMPGREMLGAAEEAGSIGAQVALVDMPIERTVGLIRKIPLREKLKLGMDSLASLVILGLGFGSRIGPGLEELAGGGEGLENNIVAFRNRYPNLSRLLIDTREEYMANSMATVLERSAGKVVAVVGLGHMASLSKRLDGHPATFQETYQSGYRTSTSWTFGP